jgi:hypothetical protein
MSIKSTSLIKSKVVMKKKAVVMKGRVGKAVVGKKLVKRLPPGYTETNSGLAIPSNIKQPVPASKIQIGFKKAKVEINSLIQEITSTMVESYTISEIELTASFSADGNFMGFGIGGAASIKIKIKPEGQ